MTPRDLFLEASKRGLRIEAKGGMLAVFPKGAAGDFLDTLRAYKSELLVWLASPPCPGWQAVPPAELPLEPMPPRPSPINRERVIHYLLRQTGDRPGPLTAWLMKRENDYYQGAGRTWDCGILSYAAARDAAAWQLNRSEAEVWGLLEATAEAASDFRATVPGAINNEPKGIQ